jgi:hypothetical protein
MYTFMYVTQILALALTLFITIMSGMHWVMSVLVLALMGVYVIRYALESED